MTRAAGSYTFLTQDALESVIRSVDSAVVLVPVWLLRRIIGYDRGIGGRPIWISHAQVHVIGRQRLLDLVEREGLPFAADGSLAETVILLARPENQWLEETSAPESLLWYWRLLFHARVQAAVQQRLQAADEAAIHERIDRVGRSVFNDARFVLTKDRFLSNSADDREAYAEFAAVFLEMYHFARSLVHDFFPAAAEPEHLLAVFGEDVDVRQVLQNTRPEGAAEPGHPLDRTHRDRESDEDQPQPSRRGLHFRKSLMKRAERASRAGNVVRSAILRVSAAREARDESGPLHEHALRDLDALVRRLQHALDLDDALAGQWRSALAPVLMHAARGWWNPEGRLLYDLQKVCIDHEREIFEIGVIEWAITLGRRPLRRSLPAQQSVLMCKHLRSASERLGRLHLSDYERGELEHLLRRAAHNAERHLREELRPRIEESLRKGGLRPANAPERIAWRKLVEELLDSILRRGYLTMGDLRDSISRNQIKCDDLGGPIEFLRGDQLLRIDRELAVSLDGVYRRGESYLRLFQRLSSLLFATRLGRFVTRYIILPFGGSYLTVAFLNHTIGAGISKLMHVHAEIDEWQFLWAFLSVGLFLFGVINWAAFRAGVAHMAKATGRALRATFVGFPKWLASRPLILHIVQSRALRLALRYIVKPAAMALLVWVLLPRSWTTHTRWIVAAAVFLAANLLNSRLGRFLEHATMHSLSVLWSRLTSDILAGIFRWIVFIFEGLLESLDRTLYAVDEWLRFRSGQRRLSLVGKAILGMVWYYVTYFTRFCINLLIEPQINPIKHFPVVTVSHKIVLPTQGLWARGLEGVGLGAVAANTWATLIVTGIPGIFGFLAWELKSNWQQYRANRLRSLRPVQVGAHGESIARLLRPGIHSGTIPKTFTKLRRSERRAFGLPASRAARRAAAVRKQLAALEHVEESVRGFMQREFVDLLNQHPACRENPLSVGRITLASTRISIELECPSMGSESAIIAFEQRWGWVLSGIERSGWIGNLGDSHARLFGVALVGLHKMAGVDIVREQVQSLFSPYPVQCGIRRDELIVWPADQLDPRIVYDLRQECPSPKLALGESKMDLPTLDRRRVLFRYVPVDWSDWVAVWEAAAGAADAQSRILSEIRVLPAPIQRRLIPSGESETWGQ